MNNAPKQDAPVTEGLSASQCAFVFKLRIATIFIPFHLLHAFMSFINCIVLLGWFLVATMAQGCSVTAAIRPRVQVMFSVAGVEMCAVKLR